MKTNLLFPPYLRRADGDPIPTKPRSRRRLLAPVMLAGALLASAATSKAALMAYEGFSYSTGSGNLSGQNGGFGWGATWQTVNNGASSVQSGSLVAGANAPAGYDSYSTGNFAFTPNNTRSGRFLDTSAGGSFGTKGYLNGGNIGANGKTIYISFMQQPNGTTSYYEFEFHRGDLGDPGRIGGLGNDSGGNTDVYLRVPAAGQTSIGPGSTSVNFYVVRIDFLGGNDTVKVYMNPTSGTEPVSPTLNMPSAGDMSFNGLSFGCFNNGRTVAHDEIRVGETWADVTAPGTYSTGAWDGGGADNNWSTAGNWDNNVVPVFATPLTFAGSTRLNNTNDLTGVSASSITFDSAAGAFSLNGNSLGLNGGIGFTANPGSVITQAINLPLTPSGNVLINVRPQGNIVINGNVTGSNTEVTQQDPDGNFGVLTLAGTNSLKGLVINNGTNRITGTTTINGIGGSSFFYLADAQTSRKSTLIIEPGATLSVNGAFQDAAVLGRDGGSGTIIQNGGTFNFNMSGSPAYLFLAATGNSSTRGEYDMNGGVLDMNGQTIGIDLSFASGVTGIVNQAGGVVTNVGNIRFNPFGQLGTGIYNLTGGSLYLGSGGITSDGGAYQMNLGGGTVGAVAFWSSAINMKLTGTGGATTFVPNGNTITLSGSLSGTGGLIVSGPGALALNGANSYTGDTTVNSGATLEFDVTGSCPTAVKLATGSTLFLNFGGNYVVSSLYLNGVLQPAGTYNSGNLPAYITGGGNLQVSSISSGIWDGGGANNNWSTGGNWDNDVAPIFPHALVFAGSTRLNNTNDLSAITISGLTFDSAAGSFTLNGNDATLNGSLSFNGNPASPVNDSINFGLTFTADQNINLPANGNVNLAGNITSGFALTKSGLGTLTLGGASDGFNYLSVNGGTNVITGNVSIQGNGNGSRFYIGDIGTVGALVIQPGATLAVTGNFGDAGVLGRDSGSGTVVQNGGTFTFNPGNVAYLFIGASSSAATRASYTMNGGMLDMSGYTLAVGLSANNSTLITGIVNQASGSIVNVGKLDLGAFTFGPGRGIYRMSGGSIYIGSAGIVSDSGVYEIYLGGGTVGASGSSWISSLNMQLTGSNGPVTFDTAGNTINLTGILSGPGGFNVTGGGVLELGGANTFTGNMNVNGGTLQFDVTGSSAGSLRVTNGSTLNLNYSGNYVVSSFATNGVALPSGTYNAGNLPAYIIGTGDLLVQTVSTGHWTGSGANNFWNTAGNWDGNNVPIFPIGLTFGGTARLNNTNNLVGVTATGLTFSNIAGAFTLNGNTLNLAGDISFIANPVAPITQTINLFLAPTANVNVNTPVNGNLAINGDITAVNNTVYKVGDGTLTLAGNNTFAGYDVDGGTNYITGTTTVSGTGGSRTYVGNGDYVGGCFGTMVIPNGGTLNMNGNFGDAFVIGRDGGSGTVVQNGGTFNYNPANQNYLFVSAGNVLTRGEYKMNGGLLDMNGKTLGLGLGVNTLVTGVVSQVSGVITNVGQLFLDSFFSTGYSIYNLSGGSLYIGSGGMTVQSGGSYELNFGGGTIGATAGWSSGLNLKLTGINGATTFKPGGNTIALSGVLSGVGGLTVSGSGILELSGANTYTGDTTVGAGSTLRLDSTSNGSGTFRAASGATLNLNYIGTLTVTNLYTNGVAIASGTYNSGNLPAYITGTGSIQVLGGGNIPPGNISVNLGGGNVNLSWPASVPASVLQVQTNNAGSGIGTNWVDVPGSSSVTNLSFPINPATSAVFYRLRQ